MHYLMFYDLVPDYLERRGEFRDAHLALARAAAARGELVLGGALAEPADQAVLLFKADSPAVAAAFAEADPYVRAGLVTQWRVRQWTTVVGDQAEHPVPA
ncbi:YciI-like protein [Bordetella petrii]|uniref:YciI-like protein n=1 Tax=Bordetella petrii TaxID=94624 RepID=A0ABT7W6F5_9BORD|nr:YciI-like protein [Bordetella petrii]MDM9560750.1 YciI-like protein [Bordetella petrii]